MNKIEISNLMLTKGAALINMNIKERMIYVIGNLVGTGKNDGGSSASNKLYCVTINDEYSFYSSVQIMNATELKSYLLSKGTVRVFGDTGFLNNNIYRITTRRAIGYYTSTAFSLVSFVTDGRFSNGYYTPDTSSAELTTKYINYSSGITSISCYEV